MKVLAIVPARSGSKGIPNKNIIQLGGFTLIEWAVNNASRCTTVTDIVISTDCEDYKNIAVARGAKFLGFRPAELSGDDASVVDVCLYELERATHAFQVAYTHILLLQPTSPFVSKISLEKGFSLAKGGADTVVSVSREPSEYYYHGCFLSSENADLEFLARRSDISARRQKHRPFFRRRGAFYICRSTILRERNTLYGDSVKGVEVFGAETICVDEPGDIERATTYLKDGFLIL